MHQDAFAARSDDHLAMRDRDRRPASGFQRQRDRSGQVVIACAQGQRDNRPQPRLSQLLKRLRITDRGDKTVFFKSGTAKNWRSTNVFQPVAPEVVLSPESVITNGLPANASAISSAWSGWAVTPV